MFLLVLCCVIAKLSFLLLKIGIFLDIPFYNNALYFPWIYQSINSTMNNRCCVLEHWIRFASVCCSNSLAYEFPVYPNIINEKKGSVT